MMETWLPRKLRLLRVRQGLTLVEAAKKTGVTRVTLSELERGHREPVAPTLAKIAGGYGVPVEELLEEPVPLGEVLGEVGDWTYFRMSGSPEKGLFEKAPAQGSPGFEIDLRSGLEFKPPGSPEWLRISPEEASSKGFGNALINMWRTFRTELSEEKQRAAAARTAKERRLQDLRALQTARTCLESFVQRWEEKTETNNFSADELREAVNARNDLERAVGEETGFTDMMGERREYENWNKDWPGSEKKELSDILYPFWKTREKLFHLLIQAHNLLEQRSRDDKDLENHPELKAQLIEACEEIGANLKASPLGQSSR